MDEENAREWNIYDYTIMRPTVIDGYSEDTSFLLLNANHAFSDGINITSALKLMDDRNDASTLPPLKGQV